MDVTKLIDRTISKTAGNYKNPESDNAFPSVAARNIYEKTGTIVSEDEVRKKLEQLKRWSK